MAKPKKLTNKDAIEMVEHHFGNLYQRVRVLEEIVSDFIEHMDQVDSFTEFRKKKLEEQRKEAEKEKAEQDKKETLNVAESK
tara:strand:- start:224 stop:469 length:246 start_codon:yes stop_codon:yes gene_type:complete